MTIILFTDVSLLYGGYTLLKEKMETGYMEGEENTWWGIQLIGEASENRNGFWRNITALVTELWWFPSPS